MSGEEEINIIDVLFAIVEQLEAIAENCSETLPIFPCLPK